MISGSECFRWLKIVTKKTPEGVSLIYMSSGIRAVRPARAIAHRRIYRAGRRGVSSLGCVLRTRFPERRTGRAFRRCRATRRASVRRRPWSRRERRSVPRQRSMSVRRSSTIRLILTRTLNIIITIRRLCNFGIRTIFLRTRHYGGSFPVSGEKWMDRLIISVRWTSLELCIAVNRLRLA